MRRSLIRPPILRSADDGQMLRHATWLELFCDLVFVVTVSELAQNLSRDVSWNGVLEYVSRHTSAWWRLGAAALLLVLGVLGAPLESAVLLAAAASICFSQEVLDVAFDVHVERALDT